MARLQGSAIGRRNSSSVGKGLRPSDWRKVIACAVVLCGGLPGSGLCQVAKSNAWITDGEVDAILPSGDTIYIGGQFNFVGPNTGGGAAIDLAHGSPLEPFPRVTGIVFAVASDGVGGWFIGGLFDAVGSEARKDLAHVLADGTVSSWNPNPSGSTSYLYGVHAVLVHESTVYVAGHFTHIDGQPRNRIAAIDAETGVPTAWNPDASSSVYAFSWGDGVLYAGGHFGQIGGQPRSNIAAIDPSTGLATNWDPDSNDTVRAIVANGPIVYVGGAFTYVGRKGRNRIAALDTVTGDATSWSPDANNEVHALAVDGTTIYAGGYFYWMGGVERRGLAALNSTTGEVTAWDPHSSGHAFAIVVKGPTVYVGGRFSVGEHDFFVGLDSVTGETTSFNSKIGGVEYPSVFAISVADNVAFVGGNFTSIGGKHRAYLAAVDSRSGQPTSWNPQVAGAFTDQTGVSSLALTGSTIFVGGRFERGFDPISNGKDLVAFDTTTGEVLDIVPKIEVGSGVSCLRAAGNLVYVGGGFIKLGGQLRDHVAAFDGSTGEVTDWSPNPDDLVRAIAVDGPTVYLGGEFQHFDSFFPQRNFIAAVDATTGVPTEWDPSSDGPVYALAVDASKVYAGGSYSTIGGENRIGLAALDASTGDATAWNPDGMLWVLSLTSSGTTVYAGGYGPANPGSPRSLGAFDKNTGLRLPWNPVVSGTVGDLNASSVHALAVSRGTVYVGGEFTNLDGRGRPNFAAIPTRHFENAVDESQVVTPVDSKSSMEGNESTLAFSPNPVRDGAALEFSLKSEELVTIRVFSVGGRLVQSLVDGVRMTAGSHRVAFDTRDWSAGAYFARLECRDTHATASFLVVR